jgi:hypothetical protein
VFIGTAIVEAQTIVFTGGESDFINAGVLPVEDEPGNDDTEFHLCFGLPSYRYDIEQVYIATDSVYLYLGVQYLPGPCFCTNNLGIAFNTELGGSTIDPLGRQIDWSLIADPPDRIVYVFVPGGGGCTIPNREAFFRADGSGGWETVVDGNDALLMLNAQGFHELRLSFDDLGTDCSSAFGIEFWTTDTGDTKPAYDMVVNDDEQRSRVSGTELDTPPVGTAEPSRPTMYLRVVPSCLATPVKSATWGAVRERYR